MNCRGGEFNARVVLSAGFLRKIYNCDAFVASADRAKPGVPALVRWRKCANSRKNPNDFLPIRKNKSDPETPRSHILRRAMKCSR